MKDFAASQLPLNFSPKLPQRKTLSSPDFQRLIATFQRIAAISGLIERDFELGRSDRDYGLRRKIRRFSCERAISRIQGGAA